MKPDTFTITTFWLDWLLLPILLAGAWLTTRWALADSRQGSDLEARRDSAMPAWAFSIPLFIAAAAWVIAGFGTLIKEDYCVTSRGGEGKRCLAEKEVESWQSVNGIRPG